MPTTGKKLDKSSKDFGITLSHTNLTREHCAYGVEDFTQKYVVTLEAHEVEGTHIHMYISMKDKIKCVDLRELLLDNLFTGEATAAINIEKLRSVKTWVKYITKEDTDVIYNNISRSEFHISYRLHDYIKSHPIYCAHDAFIRQHPQYTNVWQKAHTDYWRKNEKASIYQTNKEVVSDWSKEWVQSAFQALNNKKHVYIYGPTGHGKTTLLNTFAFQAVRSGRLITHTGGTNSPFEFSQVRADTECVIVPDAGEDYIKAHRQQILQLCDRQVISLNPKCAPITSFKFSGQVIIASNYPLPEDEAIQRRFQVIYADQNGVFQAKQEEEEVCTPEAIYISETSSEEEAE